MSVSITGTISVAVPAAAFFWSLSRIWALPH